MIDLKNIIETQPSCLNSEKQLNGLLRDMYPQLENRHKIEALMLAYKCGVVGFLSTTELTDTSINDFCENITSKYLIEHAGAKWALKTWANAYLVGYLGKSFDDTIFDNASEKSICEISLTETQKQAVCCNAHRIAVIAGPGSGKTRVLTERICLLIRQGIKESAILALTFSSKAAREMRVRLAERIGEKAKLVNVQTFHSFGLRIVRNNAVLLGLDQNVEIATASEKSKIIKKVLEEKGLPTKELSGYAKQISFYRNGQLDVEPVVSQLSQAYVNEMRCNNLIDFDDMILLTAELFRKFPTVLEAYKSGLEHVLVDEVQDMNKIQAEIVNDLTGDDTSLFVVGDDDQCIYEWRGAEPSFLRDLALKPNTTVFRLEENFRSADGIVNFSGELIGHNTTRIPKRTRAMRKVIKKSVSANIEKGSIVVKRFSSAEAEANYIGSEISKLVTSGEFCFDDFAILLRGEKQFDVLESSFDKYQIPFYVQNSDNSAYDDFVPVLKAIINPEQKQGLNRGIEYPMSIMDNFAYQEVKEKFGIDNNLPVHEVFAILNANGQDFEDCEVFRQRYRLLMQLHADLNNKSAEEIIGALIAQYSSEPFAQNKKVKTRLDHLHSLKELAVDFESSDCSNTAKSSLERFVDFLSLSAQDESTKESHEIAVNVMTCHKSKGLEFPVVFIPGIQVGTFPNDYFIKNKADIEAERRLFYVSMTRAINKLYLTCYEDPFVGKGLVKKGFLAEIPGIIIEGEKQ